MPYSSHPAVETPEPDTSRTWRYMDFTKFVSLLDQSALYFPRLTSLSDPLEGFLTKPTVERFRTPPAEAGEEERAVHESVGSRNLYAIRWARQLLFVSSWHLNQHESTAMWRLYLKSDEGIAVQSTVGRMKEAFAPEPDGVYIGRVRYVDYETEEVPWNNALYLALHKRMSFAHEQEVRALVLDSPTRAEAPGALIRVDLGTLVERVYVAPQTPPWFYELVDRVGKRYGLDARVMHSGLDEGPLY